MTESEKLAAVRESFLANMHKIACTNCGRCALDVRRTGEAGMYVDSGTSSAAYASGAYYQKVLLACSGCLHAQEYTLSSRDYSPFTDLAAMLEDTK